MKGKLLVSVLFSTLVISSGYSSGYGMGKELINIECGIGLSNLFSVIHPNCATNFVNNNNETLNKKGKKINKTKNDSVFSSFNKVFSFFSNVQNEKKFQNNEIKKEKVNIIELKGKVNKKPKNILEQIDEIKKNANERQENKIQQVNNYNIIGPTKKYNELQQEIKNLNNLLTKKAVMEAQAHRDLEMQGLKIDNLNKELNKYKDELENKKKFQNNEISNAEAFDLLNNKQKVNYIINKLNTLNINKIEKPENKIQKNEGSSFKFVISKYMKTIGNNMKSAKEQFVNMTGNSIKEITNSLSNVKNKITYKLKQARQTLDKYSFGYIKPIGNSINTITGRLIDMTRSSVDTITSNLRSIKNKITNKLKFW